MSKPRLLLQNGANYIDLNDQTRYFLAQDFVPPATAYVPQFAEGSSANQRSGGSFVSKRAANRSLSFTVALAGSSAGDIDRAARNVQMMLDAAGDPNEPVYLAYNSNSDIPEPLWGQLGSHLRYEVVHGEAVMADGYLVGVRRTEDVNLRITLILKPFAIGKSQVVASAVGGVLEDALGTANGISRGLIVPVATTNKMTNPVYGHSTWNNAWSSTGALAVSQNLNRQYMLFGFSSAKLTRLAGGAIWYQNINVGNTNTHILSCYAKRQDGGVITGSDVQLYYSSAQTTTAASVGNGWYRLTATVTGIASGVSTGIALIAVGYCVYVDGFQIEEKTYATPLCHGALLGCSWSGTSHASTSSRTAAACKIGAAKDTLNMGAGSVRFVVRFDVPYNFAENMLLLDTRDASHLAAIYLYYNATTDAINVVSNTSVVTATAALTFAAGTIYVIHVTWGDGLIKLYVDGAQADSDTYTPNEFGGFLFLGTNYAGTGNMQGTIIGAATFDVALSATEVAADYADISSLVAADVTRVESVPWFWTEDGDNVLSLTTSKLPLGVAGGIPGSAPAMTEIHGTLSSDWSTIKGIILSNFISRRGTIKIGDVLFDCSGTVLSGDYGGEHDNTVINTTVQTLTSSFTTSAQAADLLDGVEYYIVLRLKAASATSILIYNFYGLVGASATVFSPAKVILPSTSYRLFITPQNHFALNTRRFVGAVAPQVSFLIWAATSTSTLSVDTDYFAVLPRPAVILAGAESTTGFVYAGGLGHVQNTAQEIGAPLTVTGDIFEFEPGAYNHVQCYFGADGTIDPLTTYTATLSPLYVTPRYEML